MLNCQNDFESESPFTSTASGASEGQGFEEKVVNGRKIFTCTTPGCGKVFKFKSEMRRHTAIHSNQRPYVCTFPGCEKSFKRADALSNHYKIHTRSSIISDSESISTPKPIVSKRKKQKTCPSKDSKPQQKPKSSSSKTTDETLSIEDIISPLSYLPNQTADLDGLEPVKESFFNNKEFDMNFQDEKSLFPINISMNNIISVFEQERALTDSYQEQRLQNDRKTLTEISNSPPVYNKQKKDFQDNLISMLKYMSEENYLLQNEVRGTPDTLPQINNTQINQIQYQNQYYVDQQHQITTQTNKEDQDDIIDSFFNSSYWLDTKENSGKEFVFSIDLN